MLAWFLGHPMTVRPLLVSKLNTAAQILFACVVLASLGFSFNANSLQTFLLWTVAALTLILVGFYVREWWRHMNAGGASGDIALGAGVGANVLVGGSNRSFALQPLSVEGSVALDVTLGLSALQLRWVR